MNYVISVINPLGITVLTDILNKLKIPVVLSMRGRGTATKSMLDLLGMESNDKRIVMAVANNQQTEELVKQQKKRLYIDAPGNGILISVPIKSVGGGKTLSYLNGGQIKLKAPEIKFNYELILAIANEGHTDTVMDAARAAGAGGGTVIHAKGTGAANAEKFFKMSIAQEKEIILIVAESAKKTEIMTSILQLAGPDSDAGTIVFSLPVSEVQGFRMSEEE